MDEPTALELIRDLLRHTQGETPSRRALDWVVQGLAEWAAAGGSRSLESCLGLRSPGAAGNALKESHRSAAHDDTVIRLHELRVLFGLKVRDAAGIVAALIDSDEWYFAQFDLPAVAEDTVIDRYRRCRRVKSGMITANILLAYPTDEDKRRLIHQYPDWSWRHLPELTRYR